MAARRLLIIMLVLLGISSAIAVIVPNPESDDPPPPESAATGATGATGTTGDTAEAEARPDAEPEPVAHEAVTLTDGRKPKAIKAEPGARMILSVGSEEGSEVEVEGLGLAGFADPYAPAVFDLILPEDPGRYRVRAPGERPSAVLTTGN